MPKSTESLKNGRYTRTGHLRSVQYSGFSFIDLFAGIGGMRMAFEQFDGLCTFSSEIDRYARKTYEANFGHSPTGDIYEVALRDIPRHDLVLAGFPCQPFSLAGVSKYQSLGKPHGFDDASKGGLFFRLADVINYHQPIAFVLENVKNLVRHNNGATFEHVLRVLIDELGYEVSWKVLDARYVVPQHRERVFIIGLRRDLLELVDGGIEVRWPSQTGESPRLEDVLLPDAEVDPKYTISDHLWQYFQDYAAMHRARGNGFGYGLAKRDGVTRTLSARYHKDGSEILVDQTHLGKNPRRLTPRECARLMGFPDTFEIPVSDTQAYRQFGNSVVVPLVVQVAQSVVEAIGRLKQVEREMASRTTQLELSIAG